MVDIVIKEYKPFEEFIENVDLANYHIHLDYLYGYSKLIFTIM